MVGSLTPGSGRTAAPNRIGDDVLAIGADARARKSRVHALRAGDLKPTVFNGEAPLWMEGPHQRTTWQEGTPNARREADVGHQRAICASKARGNETRRLQANQLDTYMPNIAQKPTSRNDAAQERNLASADQRSNLPCEVPRPVA